MLRGTARIFQVSGWMTTVILLVVTNLSAARETSEETVENIAAHARKSIVVIQSSGRTGEQRGIGSGFVVGDEGLIATNFHVIGQNRDFRVVFADGTSYSPVAIVATDRREDLALIQIDAKGLPALKLGDSDNVRPGQRVLAIGNPLGLRFSVSDGVISETRDLDGRPMIQVAMPIEPGSSGSPLMNRTGEVLGIIAIKSAASLGFAVPINQLRRLMDDPHPIRMDRWLTIGALDAEQWQSHMGGHWRQRAGRILSRGAGSGFGGRTLCLSQVPVDGNEYDLEVEVRLEEESGAAGLVFHSDGADKHYGFYPTGGSLRLTCFEGPDVFNWRIIQTVRSEAYRPGKWNQIRVRIRQQKFQCYVNDQKVIEVEDRGLSNGKVGLVKFRNPNAEYRRFRIGKDLSTSPVNPDRLQAIVELLPGAGAEGVIPDETLEDLASTPRVSQQMLNRRAGELEEEAKRVRQLANRVHQRAVERQLSQLLSGDEIQLELAEAALLLAQLDNKELDVPAYLRMIERMASELKSRMESGMDDRQKIKALNQWMFQEWGFHGSRAEYYHRSNSYLNEVLDDREGIPITLSVIYIELAKRLGVQIEGVGLPGHFIVQHRSTDDDVILIDVYGQGKQITHQEAEQLSGRTLQESHFEPISKRKMITRILRNLIGMAENEKDSLSMLRYLDVMLVLEENAVFDRGRRAVLRFEQGRFQEALEDLDWILEREPEDVDLPRVRELRRLVERARVSG